MYPPYKDKGLTTKQSGEAVKIITQTCKTTKIVYLKYIKISAVVGYVPHTWKGAQVQ